MFDNTTVVIACNNPSRPLGRAVASVLEDNAPARVLVVAHNTPRTDILDAIDAKYQNHIRCIELMDGVHSAAGPFNLGLDSVQTPWVSIMGSDDTFAPGAVAAWHKIAAKTGADMVICRSVLGEKQRVTRTPVRRLWPRKLADFSGDRLAYRSAPLGLMRLEVVKRLGLRFTPGLPVGEDIPFSVQMYLRAKIAIQRHGPGYRIHEDAKDRVTYEPRPIAQELAHVNALLALPILRESSRAQRHHLAIKTLRSHLFGVIYKRPDPHWWSSTERKDLADFTRQVLSFSPGCEKSLALSDYRLVCAMLNEYVSAHDLLELAAARRRFGHPSTLCPVSLRALVDPEGPLRFSLASAMIT